MCANENIAHEKGSALKSYSDFDTFDIVHLVEHDIYNKHLSS